MIYYILFGLGRKLKTTHIQVLQFIADKKNFSFASLCQIKIPLFFVYVRPEGFHDTVYRQVLRVRVEIKNNLSAPHVFA